MTIVGINNYEQKKKDYEDYRVTSATPEEAEREIQPLFDDYESAGQSAGLFAAVFGLIYLSNWIDIIVFSPDFSKSTAMIDNNNNFFSFNIFSESSHRPEKHLQVEYGIKF